MFGVRRTAPTHGRSAVPVYTTSSWGLASRLRYLVGFARHRDEFDVVHTAHLPSKLNSRILGTLARRSRTEGTRFVQTLTALPSDNPERIRPLLWGDQVVCQTEAAVEAVRGAGVEPVLITPWPAPDRVDFNAKRRGVTRERVFGDRPTVLFPGEFRRLGIDRTLIEALQRIVTRIPDCLIVLACRGKGAQIADHLALEMPESVLSLGTLEDGLLDLVEAADAVVFPARVMSGKFQPPMVLLEAIALGVPVIATSAVKLPVPYGGRVRTVPTDIAWKDFGDEVALALRSERHRGPVAVPFGETLESYRRLLLSPQ